ncbi:MAG: hypothetical protein U0X20_21355 [Caldilineaceae bacterium]
MNPNDPSFNLVTVALIVMGIFIFFSVLTLFAYFFGGKDPLRWNAEARVEAAQNPGNLLQADREYRRRLGALRFFFLVAAVLVLVQIAPDEARAVADAVGAMLVEVLRVVRDSITTFLAARGS